MQFGVQVHLIFAGFILSERRVTQDLRRILTKRQDWGKMSFSFLSFSRFPCLCLSLSLLLPSPCPFLQPPVPKTLSTCPPCCLAYFSCSKQTPLCFVSDLLNPQACCPPRCSSSTAPVQITSSLSSSFVAFPTRLDCVYSGRRTSRPGAQYHPLPLIYFFQVLFVFGMYLWLLHRPGGRQDRWTRTGGLLQGVSSGSSLSILALLTPLLGLRRQRQL